MNKSLSILTSFILIFTLTGCKKDNGAFADLSREELDAEALALMIENEILKMQLEPQLSPQNTPSIEDKEDTHAGDRFIEIFLDSEIPLEFVNMNFYSFSWLNEIYPSNISGSHAYLPERGGEEFLVLSGNIKNISGDTLGVTYNSEINFVFDDKYTYSGSFTLETIGGTGVSDWSLRPLEEKRFHIYVSLPNEIVNTYSTGIIQLGFNNDFGSTSSSGGPQSCTYKYQLNFNR